METIVRQQLLDQRSFPPFVSGVYIQLAAPSANIDRGSEVLRRERPKVVLQGAFRRDRAENVQYTASAQISM